METIVNQLSGQFNFKPSRVLKWPKIAMLLDFHPRSHLVGLQSLTTLRDFHYVKIINVL